MKSGPQIALAVAAGYLLGRSRKMKLAIMVGGLLAGRRLTANPKELLEQGGKLLGSSPELTKLTGEVRERLTDAAKTAAVAAASNKIDSLGESLSKRAAGLRAPRAGEEAADTSAAEDESGEDESAEPAEEGARRESKADRTRRRPVARSGSDVGERADGRRSEDGASRKRPSRRAGIRDTAERQNRSVKKRGAASARRKSKESRGGDDD